MMENNEMVGSIEEVVEKPVSYYDSIPSLLSETKVKRSGKLPHRYLITRVQAIVFPLTEEPIGSSNCATTSRLPLQMELDGWFSSSTTTSISYGFGTGVAKP